VLTVVVCGVPDTVTTADAGPALFVRANGAEVPTPETDAVTLYVPAVVPANGIAVVAIPEPSVMAVTVVKPPNVARAPVEGAVNVTVIPDSGFAAASVTFAWSALPNDVPTVVLCGVPENAATDDGVPAAFVKLNVAVLATPETDAVTL
jgi:hypothetical protein